MFENVMIMEFNNYNKAKKKIIFHFVLQFSI